MKKYYLGIDIGTSSAKLLLSTTDGANLCVKTGYETNGVIGWLNAIKQALRELSKSVSLTEISAISVSSQVGTYITDKEDVIPWYSSVGQDELKEIKENFSEDDFVSEIGMDHPELISYPLPRLLYIKRNFNGISSVIMPKEAVLYSLTGNTVTDIFSQRGICHPETKRYSEKILKHFDIDFRLPDILYPTELAGYITSTASKEYGIPEKTAVYVGCNDFYAGLLGMGVITKNTVFELSGTSEHLGLITNTRISGKVISGKFFNGYATYGGTKSSGSSCDFAIDNFGISGLDENFIPTDQPIFLPYLKGERAPIYDEMARGVFFGVTDKTTKMDMAYAVLEGVVFSLYHIGENLPINNVKSIITGGGSTDDRLMARLKAELFNADILKAKENNSSALGAAMIAMVGDNAFENFDEAIESVIKHTCLVRPNGDIRNKLLSRYKIYKSLYLKLKDEFNEFSKI